MHQVNACLGPRNRKLGPGPASEAACTTGGVVANNFTRMDCGTVRHGFHVLNYLFDGH
ncbi:FAD-binding oxidoreductase [Corynebacterium macginleyi]|uniref:FAD-binding oxidoreductase n=1 Tax=Corynebacterium macginleyi TaxID=38290 RepID=UPI00190D378E|nr:FAD-binding oxidoreductase [Corynebacterium macginleyi]QRJ58287.1 FAD-binding oxidoreductase [Corynebacterium macginleyi]